MSTSPKVAPGAAPSDSDRPPPRLYYFNICGRAEPIRLALHLGNIEFEDIRVTAEQWKLLKPLCPYQQLPVLEVAGTQIAQTNAILRLVGKWTGLYPNDDPIKAAQIDEIICLVDDISQKVFSVLGSHVDQQSKDAQRRHLIEEVLPRWLGALDRKFSLGYLFGVRPTIADLCVFSLIQWLSTGIVRGIHTAMFQPYLHLMQLYKLVVSEERLKAYLAVHGPTKIRSQVCSFVHEFSDIFTSQLRKDLASSMCFKNGSPGSDSHCPSSSSSSSSSCCAQGTQDATTAKGSVTPPSSSSAQGSAEAAATTPSQQQPKTGKIGKCKTKCDSPLRNCVTSTCICPPDCSCNGKCRPPTASPEEEVEAAAPSSTSTSNGDAGESGALPTKRAKVRGKGSPKGEKATAKKAQPGS